MDSNKMSIADECDEGDLRKHPVLNEHLNIKDFSKTRRSTICVDRPSQLPDFNSNHKEH